MPGTTCAVPQVPCVSSTTNGRQRLLEFLAFPPALQFPADAHDTEMISNPPRAVLPGTCCAVPQVPFVSLTTNAPAPSAPPALQLPADAHDTE